MVDEDGRTESWSSISTQEPIESTHGVTLPKTNWRMVRKAILTSKALKERSTQSQAGRKRLRHVKSYTSSREHTGEGQVTGLDPGWGSWFETYPVLESTREGDSSYATYQRVKELRDSASAALPTPRNKGTGSRLETPQGSGWFPDHPVHALAHVGHLHQPLLLWCNCF